MEVNNVNDLRHLLNTTKDDKPRRPFNLDLFEVDIDGFKTYLVYGEPKNLPFGSVTTKDKLIMGELLNQKILNSN